MLAVVVDTSVWVSAFLNPRGYPARIYQAAHTGQFELLISLPLLNELAEVLARPRLQRARRLTSQRIEIFVSDSYGVQIVTIAQFLQQLNN